MRVRSGLWVLLLTPSLSPGVCAFLGEPTGYGDSQPATRNLALGDRGVTDTGTFGTDGCKVRIEINDTTGRLAVRSGTVDGGRLKLVFHAQPGVNEAFTEEFTFEAVNFDEITLASAVAQQQAVRDPSAPPELMVGTATMDGSCTKVAFQAASSPAVFAAGTQALAVQLTGTFPAVSLTGGTVCRAGGLAMMTCNQYAIMQGQPQVIRQTTIVACKDQRSLAAGRYVIRAGAASVPVTVR
jgi:hypothetical protein